jgi:hypothetical protein
VVAVVIAVARVVETVAVVVRVADNAVALHKAVETPVVADLVVEDAN